MVRTLVRSFIVLVSLGVLVSCDTWFDSYFPDSVEYLQNQVDVAPTLGNKAPTSMQLGYLPSTAYHLQDDLVMVATTTDGESHVVFFDPSSLSQRRSYSSVDLKAINGGSMPSIDVLAQDHNGLYTGGVLYDSASRALLGSPGLPLAVFTSGGQTHTSFKTAFDGINCSTVGPFSGTVGVQPDFDFPATTAFITIAGMPLMSQPSVLDYAIVGGRYLMVISDNMTAYLSSGPSTAFFTIVPVPLTTSSRGGWATSRGAVVRTHSDNSALLTAYTWSGAPVATLHLAEIDGQTLAITFDPQGNWWYCYDSTTGKLSRSRAWW